MTETETPLPEGATVQIVGDPSVPTGVWHLVEFGTWQISIGPDGLIQLPRSLLAREVTDFVGAITAAAQVAARVVADNEARAAGDNRALPPGRAIVTEGPPPAGATPMVVTAGPGKLPPNQLPQAAMATIGRPRRGERRIAPPGARV